MDQNVWRLGSGLAPIGALLANERERQGLSQGELARRLGVAQSNLSRIEHGADMRMSTLLDIARVLQLEPMLVPKSAARGVRVYLSDVFRRHSSDSANMQNSERPPNNRPRIF